MERLSEQGHLNLYYADQSRVSTHGYVPYGWQFDDEEVWMPAQRGPGINCFALLSRACECRFETTLANINSDFFVDFMERFSGETQLQWQKEDKLTVIVVDNASVHSAKQVQQRRPVWEERGLFLFYLPPYSPHLNLAEVLWRKLKGEWLQPADYLTGDLLFYAVTLALAAIGSLLHIHFSPFRLS